MKNDTLWHKRRQNHLCHRNSSGSEDVQSDDGVANACIAEAADRIEELEAKASELNQKLCRDMFRLRGS